MDKVKEILQFIGLKILFILEFLWKHIKRGYKKARRWFKRYVRMLIRHTKAKDYSLLIYTIIAIIVFILLIVLLGKAFSHKSKKDKKVTTENTSVETTEDPEIAMQNELINQANVIYQNNSDFLVLINQNNPIQEGYAFEHYTLNCGEVIDERIHTDLVNMLNACNEAGNEYSIVSGYRDRSAQQKDLEDTVSNIMLQQGLSAEDAAIEAAKSVQQPGFSEHETGLALDIAGLDYVTLDESLINDATVQWLDNNCYMYGFIVRYPEGKTDVTGIIFEPWHFRYVGVEAATFMHNNNLTLEEFYQLIGM